VIISVTVYHYLPWLSFLLWLTAHLMVALLALVHGLGIMLCKGKYHKLPFFPSWNQPPFGRHVVQVNSMIEALNG
jgi:hypothetical protein